MSRYQIFGSKSSQDYDVLVFVNELGTISENHELVKKYNEELALILPGKNVNANLGVLEDGMITKVFKGTTDEVNNSMYHTFANHPENYKQHVTALYSRKGFYTHLKMKRCLRFILSFYSRVPEWRPDIKVALRGTVFKRLECCEKIDFTKHTEFPGKKEKKEDIYKVLAFQIMQTFRLYWGYEIYSKEEVLAVDPLLGNFINRKEITHEDLVVLDKYFKALLYIIRSEAYYFESAFEEVYNSDTN